MCIRDRCAFVRVGGMESCWVRIFSICEDFSSVCAFVTARGMELCWVRKFFICDVFSIAFVRAGCIVMLGEEIFHL